MMDKRYVWGFIFTGVLGISSGAIAEYRCEAPNLKFITFTLTPSGDDEIDPELPNFFVNHPVALIFKTLGRTTLLTGEVRTEETRAGTVQRFSLVDGSDNQGSLRLWQTFSPEPEINGVFKYMGESHGVNCVAMPF